MLFLPDPSILLAYSLACFILFITPGPDMSLFLAKTVQGGRSAGIASLSGATAGCLVHSLAAAFGLSALIAASATAFNVLKIVGALYLLWMAYSAVRHGSMLNMRGGDKAGEPAWTTFMLGLGMNLTNPKVILFFLTPPAIRRRARSERRRQIVFPRHLHDRDDFPALRAAHSRCRALHLVSAKKPARCARHRLRLRRRVRFLRDPGVAGAGAIGGAMADTNQLSERIDALEMRVAYQDDTIEKLNEVVTAQWAQIDALKRQIAALSERLDEASAAAGPRDLLSEKPPHY